MSRKNNKNKSKKTTNKNKKGLKKAIQSIFDKQPDQKYNYKQISSILSVEDSNTRKLVGSVLNELKSSGYLNEISRGAFILNENYSTNFVGTVDATSKGSAYIIIDQHTNDIYVRPENMNRAFHGDTVEVSVIKHRKTKVEGKIDKIVQRKTTQFVGQLQVNEKYAFLILDNKKIHTDLYIPLNKLKDGTDGDKAIGHITSWPKDVDNPFGEIDEIIGKPGDNNTEMLSILLKNEFKIDFPQGVVEEAEKVGIELDAEEVKKRRDLRNELTFTIDPVDAKDFDDALSYEKLDNGNHKVGVHIADVSHYVQLGTAMDEEALKRGNSVYLEDRVIPMLPEQLSNMACSLRPNEDKFAFTALFNWMIMEK